VTEFHHISFVSSPVFLLLQNAFLSVHVGTWYAFTTPVIMLLPCANLRLQKLPDGSQRESPASCLVFIALHARMREC
jgi:hypothetical protein